MVDVWAVCQLVLAGSGMSDLHTGFVGVWMELLWRRIDWEVRPLLMLGQPSDVLMS